MPRRRRAALRDPDTRGDYRRVDRLEHELGARLDAARLVRLRRQAPGVQFVNIEAACRKLKALDDAPAAQGCAARPRHARRLPSSGPLRTRTWRLPGCCATGSTATPSAWRSV